MSNSSDFPPNQPPQPQYNPQQPYPGYPQGYPQPPQQPPKKKKTALIIGIIIGALVLCGLCGGIATIMSSHSGGSTTTTTTTTSNTSTSSSTPTKPPTTTKPLTWQTTHSFSGNGEKKTDVFTVADTWKIKYTCQGMGQGIDGVLGVSVYGSDGTIQDVAVNATCKDGKTTSDVTTEHTGGQVYLDVTATGDWTVDVMEQK